jgi:hydrogenase expression/formation protein HypC
MQSGSIEQFAMCLAIPGKIVELEEEGSMRMGRIDYGGITRQACLAYIPDPRIGEYVMVHVGFAISKVDAEEAARTYQYLAEMNQLEEIAAPEAPPEAMP